MTIHPLHPWELTPTATVALQRELAAQIDTQAPLSQRELIDGADVSYGRFSNIFFAQVVVVLRMADLNIVE